MIKEIRDSIFKIRTEEEFWETTLRAFNYQSLNNKVYKDFVTFLGRDLSPVKTAGDIPFLPVEFFRNHKIITGERPVEMIFESSGTTGVTPARHYVSDLALYERSFFKSFRLFYSEPGDYLIIALLPSYTERAGSSLAYMADKIIKESHHPQSGFYKGETDAILNVVKKGMEAGSRILLLGVSFALLDLAESCSPDFSGVTIIETGGMKGRRKELTRSELHSILKEKFNVNTIHSEYGMTELLSQAYSSGNGIFYCPPWMRIVIRDPQDPLSLFSQPGKTGGINIIDLANLNSCSFIATGDLGKLHEDGGFEVLGRFDNSDIRGCNLLAE
jgi:phenylacetate-coenzyme A ligase PaaK-like adenylate-forming protein